MALILQKVGAHGEISDVKQNFVEAEKGLFESIPELHCSSTIIVNVTWMVSGECRGVLILHYKKSDGLDQAVVVDF